MRLYRRMLDEVLEERAVSSRGRQVPRGVRRRSNQYPVRKRGQTTLAKGIDYGKAVEVIELM